MTKRIISALLCIIVLSLTLSIATFAEEAEIVTALDKKVASINLYADENVEVGKEFVVSIFIEAITVPSGVLANDLPLYYDRDKLTALSVEPVYPDAWLPFADFFGHKEFDEYPYYLRSLPDAADIMTNPAYRITKSKEIGYKIKFKANKVGEAFVGVENDDIGKYPIMLVSVENTTMYNYSANGETIMINICEELPGDISGDTSNEQSADLSVDVSTDVELSTEASSEPFVSEDVSESTDASESTKDEESLSSEASDDASVAEPSKGGVSGFVFFGLTGVAAIIVCILFIVVIIALAVGIAIGAVIFSRKKTKQ